jgi:hypothetical protein
VGAIFLAMKGFGPRFGRASDVARRILRRPRSLRLTFAYDEAGLRLIDHTPRMKPAPPSDRLYAEPRRDAIIAELRTKDGAPLYRKRLYDPIPQHVEVHDPETGLRREPSAPRRGSFSVVVPSEQRADHVVIEAGPAVVLSQLPSARRDDARDERYLLGRFAVRRSDP